MAQYNWSLLHDVVSNKRRKPVVFYEEAFDDAVIKSLTSSTSANDAIGKKRKIRQATEAGRRRVYRRI
ncbi:hypothetical protein PC116_g12047 [Phytophthora cactorum]|nr:hypothetical protein PC116_g12047 [Phytophthora cactorum]